jgi:hypothetical protein
VPFPWSETEPSEPPVVESATVSPPATRLVPEASFSWTVIVEVELPSAWIEVGLTEMVEVAPEAGPAAAVKVTEATLTIAPLLTVALTMPLPTLAGAVSVAV